MKAAAIIGAVLAAMGLVAAIILGVVIFAIGGLDGMSTQRQVLHNKCAITIKERGSIGFSASTSVPAPNGDTSMSWSTGAPGPAKRRLLWTATPTLGARAARTSYVSGRQSNHNV